MLVRVVILPISLGIGPVNRFPRSDLHFINIVIYALIYINIHEDVYMYMLTSGKTPHSGGMEPLR